MAFPTIPTAGAGRLLSNTNTNPAGTHTSPSLSSLTNNSGDLLIAIVIIYDGNSTNAEFSSWGGGFTEFVDQATTATMGIGCAYKWSTGSETGTFTVTSADTSANDSAFFLLSIAGAHDTTPPEGGTIADGTSTAADPGSFNPGGWDAEDTLWIAVGGSGETGTGGAYQGISSAPTNYTDLAVSGISADVVGGVEGAVAFRQLNAASEDVGGFSVDTSNARNSALILAIRPAAASTQTLDGDTGSYSITGSAATFTISLAASTGVYDITGSAATFLETMAADTGSYAINGSDATFSQALVLLADSGVYSLTGSEATFLNTLAADTGAYSFTGSDATFSQALVLLADTGVYNLSGSDATFNMTIVADSGSYAHTGSAATFVNSLNAETGSYIINGSVATFEGVEIVEVSRTFGMLASKHIRRKIKK
jgi:hypothetical protein